MANMFGDLIADETEKRFGGSPDREARVNAAGGLMGDELLGTSWKNAHRRSLRVCLVGYSFYETDNRKLRYAQALTERGDRVEAIGLRGKGQKWVEVVDGVRVFRIQRRERNERGLWTYGRRLLSFFIKSWALISWRSIVYPYDIVQVHSVPDFLVFSALLAKCRGSKVIFEIQDVAPEFYLSKFGKTTEAMMYRFLRGIERVATGFADRVIIANHIWGEMVGRRTECVKKILVSVNYINDKLFDRREKKARGERFVVVYPGGFNWHQGVDIAVEAFALFKRKIPNAEFHLYGEGTERQRLEKLANDLGVGEAVFFHDTVPFSEVPDILAGADLGVVGKRADVFGNTAYSTKVLEYMSQGIPVVVPRTKVDSYYFYDSIVSFFEPGNPQDMARAMIELAVNERKRNRLIRNAHRHVQGYRWSEKKKEYLAFLDGLLEERTSLERGSGWKDCQSLASGSI